MSEMADDELLGGEDELDDVYDITNEREEALLQDDDEYSKGRNMYEDRKKDSYSDLDEQEDVLSLDIEEDLQDEDKLLYDEDEPCVKRNDKFSVERPSVSKQAVQTVTKAPVKTTPMENKVIPPNKSAPPKRNMTTNVNKNVVRRGNMRKRGIGRGNFQTKQNFVNNNSQRRRNGTVLINPRYEGTVHVNENNARLAWDNTHYPQNKLNNIMAQPPWPPGNVMGNCDTNPMLMNNLVTNFASNFATPRPSLLIPPTQLQPQLSNFYEPPPNYERPLSFEPPPHIVQGRRLPHYNDPNQVISHQMVSSQPSYVRDTHQPHVMTTNNRLPGNSPYYSPVNTPNTYNNPSGYNEFNRNAPYNYNYYNDFQNRKPNQMNDSYQNRNTNYSPNVKPPNFNNYSPVTRNPNNRNLTNVENGNKNFRTNNQNSNSSNDKFQNKYPPNVKKNFDKPTNFQQNNNQTANKNPNKQENRRPADNTNEESSPKKPKMNDSKNVQPVNIEISVNNEQATEPQKEAMIVEEDEETRLYRLKIEEQKRERERILRIKEERRKQMILERKQQDEAKLKVESEKNEIKIAPPPKPETVQPVRQEIKLVQPLKQEVKLVQPPKQEVKLVQPPKQIVKLVQPPKQEVKLVQPFKQEVRFTQEVQRNQTVETVPKSNQSIADVLKRINQSAATPLKPIQSSAAASKSAPAPQNPRQSPVLAAKSFSNPPPSQHSINPDSDIPNLTFKISNDLRTKPPPTKDFSNSKTEASSSSFMSNRVVVVKSKNSQNSGIINPIVTVPVDSEPSNEPSSGGLSSFFNNRKVLKKDSLLNTRLVVVNNLSATINQNKLTALSNGIGEIQSKYRDEPAWD